MKTDDVRPLQEFIQLDVFDDATAFVPANRIGRKHVATEAVCDTRRDGANVARANDTEGLARQIEAHQPIQRKVAMPHSLVSKMDLPIEAEQQRESVLGDRIRRIGRHARDGDVVGSSRLQIDIVETGRA